MRKSTTPARLPTMLLVPIACLLSAAPAAAQPLSGTYRARPAQVLACGGLIGDCRALTLDGTLELAVAVPDGGANATLQILSSDLHLRAADGNGDAFPFPAPGDLQLSELVDDSNTSELLLTAPKADGQSATLRVTPVGSSAVVLQGTYDEGCCDRFVYELGTVLFERQGFTDSHALVLRQGRFRVLVEWTDFDGLDGPGTPVKLDEQSGTFWFFRRTNPELLVKVLDGCAINGHFWFFAAGLTNVAVDIEVIDSSTPLTATYHNPLRRPFEPILDTEAIVCNPVI